MKDEVGATGQATRHAQHMLKETGVSLITRDFDRFAEHFSVPQTLLTPLGSSMIETRDDLRATFDSICAFYDGIGATSLDRHVETALFDGPDCIRFVFSCTICANDTPVRAPFRCTARIENQNGSWRCVDNQYAVGQDKTHADALTVVKQKIEHVDPSPDAPSAEVAVMQNLLETVTHCYLHQDFDTLLKCVKFPIFMQRNDATYVFQDSAKLSEDFRRYKTEFEAHDITDIVRVVKMATLIGERRIQGVYRTYVMRDTEFAIPPYSSSATLEQGTDLVWRLTSILQPMGHLLPVRGDTAQSS